MKTIPSRKHPTLRSIFLPSAILLAALALFSAGAQTIQWGLTLTNINNPITPIVITNAAGNTNAPGGTQAPIGSITIIAGGGDAWGVPDSFTYAYEQLTGDFDKRVRIINNDPTDPQGQDSPRGSLMVRAGLQPNDYNIQIDAEPLAPSGRNGQICSIARIVGSVGYADDMPGRGKVYGGSTTEALYTSYPDLWLRIQRQGDKFMTYFATTNTTDAPPGFAANPGSTNGWQLLGVVNSSTTDTTNLNGQVVNKIAFPKTIYFGLATVAHNSDSADSNHVEKATYADYGPTPSTPSIPTLNAVPVAASNAPGPFPNKAVSAVNWHISLPANGQGYPADIVQSAQGAAAPIVWNSGGFGSVSRDIILDPNTEQTSPGFSVARYQAGAIDFMLSPRDPVAAQQNLGPYSNPNRERFGTGNISVPASQAWAPSPNYGFAISTVRKNGQQWNDTAPYFNAATYIQLDKVATGAGFDMMGGHFRGAQFYTRTTKLVTGSPTDPGSDLGGLQRCAISLSLAFFPYDQGWKAGYFDGAFVSDINLGVAHWKYGEGFGLHSGTAVSGMAILGNPGQATYNAPTDLLEWFDQNGGNNYMAKVRLPGVNSQTNGMLFTVANDEGNSLRGNYANNAPRADGSGWDVWIRGIGESAADPTLATGGVGDNSDSFSFLYVPFDADNLVGGVVHRDGTLKKQVGTYTVAKLSTGRYSITIPGKSEATGMLLLQNSGYLLSQPAGYTNVADTSFLSYEYGGTNTPSNAFIVESRYIAAGPATALRDAEFSFVYLDFQNPIAPPGTVQPVVSITRNGGNVVVSWSNGPGFILQQTSSLAGTPVWSTVGTANPSAPIAIGSGPTFFRVKNP
jgi:hypothetical protein